MRPLAPREGAITSGVLVGFGIRYVFLKTVTELLAEGIALSGLYVVWVRDDEDASSPFQRRYLGRVENIRDGMVMLSDSDIEEFPADQCYLEGSRTNIEVVGRALLAEGYDAFARTLLDETFKRDGGRTPGAAPECIRNLA